MTRVATIPMHGALFNAIGRAQQKLAASQLQMATGKKANDFAALGVDGIRNISARSVLARQDAQRAVSQRLGTTLSLYDAHLSGAEGTMSSLRNKMLEAIGTGQSSGLQEAIDQAFQQFRTAMNADDAGVPLFAGSQTDGLPFTPATLADTIGLPPSGAFANDDVNASARVGDGLDIRYGLTASDIGTELFEAFRTIAEAGPLGASPASAQVDALKTAIGQIDGGLKTLRSAWADNGRRQAQLETLTERAEERGLILHRLISRNEDADMAEVASRLTQQQTVLEASYSVFARLSGLSLVNYLR